MGKKKGLLKRLQNKGRKGYRQPSKKDLESKKAKEMRRAQDFLDKYQKVCQETGLQFDIKYVFDENTGLTAQLKLIEHVPPPEVKPWSVALQENLDLRSECKHEMHKEMTKCKKCELNPENWGGKPEYPKGVTAKYQAEMKTKIIEQKLKEDGEQKEETKE